MPEVLRQRSGLLKSRSEQGVWILTITAPQLRGDTLVHALSAELAAALAAARAPKVVLDLQAVTALCSEGFRPLLSLRRKVQESGGRLVLCNLAPLVAQALQATRLV